MKNNLRKYFVLLVLFLLIIVSVMIIRPFLPPILVALLLAYIFNPVYLKLKRILRKKSIAAIVSTIFILLIIGLPLVFVANTFAQQTHTAYILLKKEILTESFYIDKLGLQEFSSQMKAITVNAIEKGSTGLINFATSFMINVPKMILSFFIMLFVMFYTFTHGKEFVDYLFSFVPMREKNKEHLRKRFERVVTSLIYGIILIGILQGIFGTIGFYIFNIPTPLFWGIIMTVLSILPVVGTWLVWIPAAILELLAGDMASGIGLLVYGAIIMVYFESFARPHWVGKRANIHPLIVLLGVFGGIVLFGILGVVLGPLILALTLSFLDIYRKELM